MALLDLISRRRKSAAVQVVHEAYRYDEIPESLRVQVLHILDEVLGDATEYHAKRGPDGPRQAYAIIVETLCREYGLATLTGARSTTSRRAGGRSRTRRPNGGTRDHRAELWEFMLGEQDLDRLLDAIELSFRCIDYLGRRYEYLRRREADPMASRAIAQLNARFREHRVGYSYQRGEIVRIS